MNELQQSDAAFDRAFKETFGRKPDIFGDDTKIALVWQRALRYYETSQDQQQIEANTKAALDQ